MYCGLVYMLLDTDDSTSVDPVGQPMKRWRQRMPWLFAALMAMNIGCAAAAPPVPTPEPSYAVTGAVTAPACLGGFNIIDASVTARNERDEIIGSATTTYTGDQRVLDYERAKQSG